SHVLRAPVKSVAATEATGASCRSASGFATRTKGRAWIAGSCPALPRISTALSAGIWSYTVPMVFSCTSCAAVAGPLSRTLMPIVPCSLVAAVAVAMDGRGAVPVMVSGERSHAATVRTRSRVPDIRLIRMGTPPRFTGFRDRVGWDEVAPPGASRKAGGATLTGACRLHPPLAPARGGAPEDG